MTKFGHVYGNFLTASSSQASNFDMDQAGMKHQLLQLQQLLLFASPELAQHLQQKDSGNMYFCFRWLLVWFKREFSHRDIMR